MLANFWSLRAGFRAIAALRLYSAHEQVGTANGGVQGVSRSGGQASPAECPTWRWMRRGRLV
jgi:hypothetical protein